MHETTDATAIFAPLWRRKWLILLVGVIAAVGTYLYYKREAATYAASTQVYLGSSAEEAIAGEKAPGKASTGEVNNEAAIINTFVVAEVKREFRRRGKGAQVRRARVRAKAQEKSSFITISAEGRGARGTELLVNTVAQAYITRRNASREGSIDRAIAIARRQLARVEAAAAPVTTGKGRAALSPSGVSLIQAANLSSKINQLEASRTASGAQQVNPAAGAELVSPKPRQDAIFGFVIGIALASIAAYAIGRLDRRLRTLEGIESIFGSQVLAALPKVGRPVVLRSGEPSPSRLLLEPIRRLHTMLSLGVPLNGQTARPRTILFLSPDAGDGKSTIVADLALVARDGGDRVAIAEANFRRPAQARLLALPESRGLAGVLTGSMTVEEAAQRVTPVPVADERAGDEAEPAGTTATAVATRSAGALFLLAGSRAVANPPALLADAAAAELLQSLRQEFDYVLIDAPSPLEFSDVMPLLRLVDGVVLVARAGHTRELSAQRFMQLLASSSSAPVLGIVANCVSKRDLARHGSARAQQRSWIGSIFAP